MDADVRVLLGYKKLAILVLYLLSLWYLWTIIPLVKFGIWQQYKDMEMDNITDIWNCNSCRTEHTTDLIVEHFEDGYAWGICECKNTVKFSGIGKRSVCACCGTFYMSIKDATMYKYPEIEEHYRELLLENGQEWAKEHREELHHIAFNEDYYIIGTHRAKEWLADKVFDVIEIIRKYEQDNFGEVNTDFSDPEKIVNMYVYIVGEQVVNDITLEDVFATVQ